MFEVYLKWAFFNLAPGRDLQMMLATDTAATELFLHNRVLTNCLISGSHNKILKLLADFQRLRDPPPTRV